MRLIKKTAALAFAFVIALTLAACGGSNSGSSDSSSATDELKGSPWVMSILQGNLPAE